MAKRKIDHIKLSQLLRAGKSVKACAKFFNVTPSAICQAKDTLSLNVVKNVALENAHRMVSKSLNTIEQLNKINQDANEILDLVMGWARGDEKCIRILETQVKKVKWRDKDSDEERELDVQEIKFKDPRELALKAMAEIRHQIKLQMDIYQMLYDVKAAAEFQQEVLAAIGEADKDVRDRIIHNLRKKRAIRSVVKYN